VAPKRLLLGSDAYAVVTAALHQRLDELDRVLQGGGQLLEADSRVPLRVLPTQGSRSKFKAEISKPN
jgi:hypothetical protein